MQRMLVSPSISESARPAIRTLTVPYWAPMQLRDFGNTSLRVSEYGLGCARIGGVFQGSASGFLDLLSFAFDRGINFYDTADMYSQGESEALIGKALRGRRDRVIIASKVGYRLGGRRRLAAKLKPLLRPLVQKLKLKRDKLPSASKGAISQDFSAAYLRSAVEGSLRRLRTDHLDVLQLHSPPLEVIERGEWLPTLEELQRTGKVRYYGIAVDTLEAGLAALRYANISSLQFRLSLLEPQAAEELFPRAREQGVGTIARECLGNGLLAKPADQVDLKANCSSVEEEERRAMQLAELRGAAAARGLTLLQTALAYPPSVPGVGVTLLGARSVEQLRGLLSAAQR
ncbi:MAG: aldo/keto reductase [Myxococcales bacterium]|nr:MAG: aldo/keto reductase [Myxococcales bacterium]